MGFKIKDYGIRKIAVPVVCEYGGRRKTFANGAILAETALDRPYEVDKITAENGTIVIALAETEAPMEERAITWIGEEAVLQTPRYDKNEEWVKTYEKQFGNDPSFF